MAGLLDFLTMDQTGGGLLGLRGGQTLPDMLGGNQGMMLAGLGLAGGATPAEGFKNMLPALQMAFDQQQGRRAGMALLNALPGAGAPASPAAAPAAAPGGGGQYAPAIAGIESGGKYDATGPVTKTGDRAYGKYQVMGANIGPWTQEVIGKPMTPQEFVANPQAQDAVFKAKFGQLAQKYGPDGAARAWFAGEGGMNNPNATDQLGTSVSQYAQRFNAGQQPQAMAATSPQLGGNMPGSGLTLIDSPALQGMPEGVRKAMPLMLQSRQYAPMAMQMIQKYINPEQWQLYRDTMGNVFTRNSATGESKPLIQATPQMMNANASGLPTPLAYETATAFGQSAAKNTELTGEQKNAAASGNMTPLQFKNAEMTTEQKNARASGVETPAQYATLQAQNTEAGQKRGAAEGEAQAGLGNAITQAQLALKTIDQVRNHPGKDSIGGVGITGVLPGIPGTQQKGFVTLVDQLKNKTFLQAYESLRGGGAITNIEGVKAESAIARLDRAQNKTDFDTALNDLEDVIKIGMRNARMKAAGISQPKSSAAADPLGIR